jgi:murein DD-endopeptidase MepM/ murein hydrolase activator NlpD
MNALRKRYLLAAALAAPPVWMLLPWLKVLCWGLPLCFKGEPAQLPMPISRVRLVEVADTFGAPRSGGRRHEGVDIFAPRHTPVLSTTAGVVVFVGDNRLGGQAVQILGPGGQWHYFAHLESFGEVRVGQRIPIGFPVGTVGDSGNAKGTPPHLHYGTYSFFRQAEDPLPKLRGGSRMASR